MVLVTDFLDPLVSLWNSFVTVIPGLVFAIILLAVGYLVSFIIGRALKIVLVKAKLDQKIEQAKISKAIGYVKVSSLLGELVKWFLFVIFLQAAVDQLELGTLSDILGMFVLWLPHLIVAVTLLIVGLLFAQFVRVQVEEHARTEFAKVASHALMVVIAVIVFIIALDQIGIELDLVKNLIYIVVGAFGIGAALAMGLSFGLGNQKEANEMLKSLRKRL